MQKPLILITNDDGINAPGIRHLISVVKEIGNVVVVAPDQPRSATSHSITVSKPVRFSKISDSENYSEYSCDGTPVDCVKIAVDKILGRKPDILVSGINHGSNASVNILYSGTMSAAMEGLMINIPSIGFSLNDYSYKADFTHTSEYIKNIVKTVLINKLPDDICLNVNFPVNKGKIKGVKVCRQANGRWNEAFEERTDPYGRNYYWLTGNFESFDTSEDTDEWAMANNYVAIVPIHCDYTSHRNINVINKWNFNV